MRRLHPAVWLTALAGVLLSLSAWQFARGREARATALDFRRDAAQLARAVEWEARLYTDVLQSLGALHALSDRIEARDLEEFAGKGLQHPLAVLGPFGLAQKIPLSVRAALEGDPAGLRIVEPSEDGRLRVAGLRPLYFPLTYQYPAGGLRMPDGFDLAALPGNAAAIARLETNAAPALGEAVVDGSEGGRTLVFVLAPIREGAVLSGFSVAQLDPQALLHRALDRSFVRDLTVTLYDPARGAPEEAGPTRLALEQAVVLADRLWVCHAAAAPAYVARHRTPLPWIVLGAGLAVTLLLALQLQVLSARTTVIEQTVRERTAALTEANERLAAEMEERARLEAAVRDVAQEEQARIGRDLHDSLGQKLAGAVYMSRALAGQLAASDAGAAADAGAINEVLKDAVAQVRRTARGLAPVEIGEDGLAQALRHLAEEVCRMHPVACSFRQAGSSPGGLNAPRVAAELYKVAQEAVNNAVRHGQPREVVIALDLAERVLTVEDDGTGLSPAASQTGGAGLRIMRHRARSLGGELSIAPRPPRGTTVRCTWLGK